MKDNYKMTPASLPYIRPGRTLIILAVGIVFLVMVCVGAAIVAVAL